jgi:hypothetical protein
MQVVVNSPFILDGFPELRCLRVLPHTDIIVPYIIVLLSFIVLNCEPIQESYLFGCLSILYEAFIDVVSLFGPADQT